MRYPSILFILMFSCTICPAAEFIVDQQGGGDYTNIQSAINATVDGDSVLVMPGDYWITRPISFLGKAITVMAEADPTLTAITMSDSPDNADVASVVSFTSGEGRASILQGFILRNGRGTSRRGGGVYCVAGSAPTLVNCIIMGNKAGIGGGVYCGEESAPVLLHCTITGNFGGFGGGIYCFSSFPVLTNCIVWNNANDGIYLLDLASNPTVTFSCIQGEDAWRGEGNINEDPLFATAGFWDENGTIGDSSDDFWMPGDYHVKEGSPCLDTGSSNTGIDIVIDIEGNARRCEDDVDMGAHECCGCSVPPPPTFIRGEVNADGGVDLADAISVLTFLFADGDAPACMDAADGNDDGGVDLADCIAILSHLFADSGPLAPPFPDCGPDTTLDALTCDGDSGCL